LLQRKRKLKREHKRKENFDPCACAYACVNAVFTDGGMRIIILALVLASLVETRVESSEQTGDS